MDEALKTAELLGDSIFSYICEELAAIGKTEPALKWIEKQKNPKIKAESLIGVVSGLMSENSNQMRYGSIELSQCK